MIVTIQIRTAVPNDALAVARVHVRSWQAAYRGLLPGDYLDGLRPEDRAARYDFTHRDPAKPYTRIAVDGEAIVGFATTMPTSDPSLPGYGELCALYVDPDRWGSGLGAALMVDARNRMAGQGFRHALLWLLKGNDRADRFYRRDGWSPDGKHKRELMWGIEVEDLRYQRPLL
jgi:GNAT superfamily N-acetyltransferase